MDNQSMAPFAHGHTEPAILIGTGQCGLATGSATIANALRAASNGRVAIIESGCNGLCFLNPQVTVMAADRPPLTLGPIREGDCNGLIDLALGASPPPDLGAVLSWDPHSPSRAPIIADHPWFADQRRWLMRSAGFVDPISMDAALERGRYRGLAQALEATGEELIDVVMSTGLGGRGGAYFPIARKWQGCRAGGPKPRYLVVNAEEGEPGVVKDRHLMEADPHLIVEGMLLAAYAIEADKIIVFINGHAHPSIERMTAAIEAARARNLVGHNILGSDFSCEIAIQFGAGGYVLGEESAMLEALEGHRPMPRVRPPFPVIEGLFGHPTDISNVETLANVALIAAEGPEGFLANGTDLWHGTKLITVSGDVERPGVYEIPFGLSLRTVVEQIAGGVREGRPLQAVLSGGPSGMLVPPSMLDTPLEPRRLDVLLGSGNLIVLDDRHDLLEIVQRLTLFNACESCGKCTPCREGVHRMAEILDRVAHDRTRATDREDLLLLCDLAAHASICGLGQMAPNPVRTGLMRFDLGHGLNRVEATS